MASNESQEDGITSAAALLERAFPDWKGMALAYVVRRQGPAAYDLLRKILGKKASKQIRKHVEAKGAERPEGLIVPSTVDVAVLAEAIVPRLPEFSDDERSVPRRRLLAFDHCIRTAVQVACFFGRPIVIPATLHGAKGVTAVVPASPSPQAWQPIQESQVMDVAGSVVLNVSDNWRIIVPDVESNADVEANVEQWNKEFADNPALPTAKPFGTITKAIKSIDPSGFTMMFIPSKAPLPNPHPVTEHVGLTCNEFLDALRGVVRDGDDYLKAALG